MIISAPETTLIPASTKLHDTQIQRIYAQLKHARTLLASDEVAQVQDAIPESRQVLSKIHKTIESVQERLEDVPPIEIALLGPSRHGKSTLLNALAGCEILPTSDVKPCTAAIVRLRRADEWSMKLKFVSKEDLRNDWKNAVRDAEDYLKRMEAKDTDCPDDPRYLMNILQRYIEFFNLNPEQDPWKLVEQVKNNRTIKGQLAQYLSTDKQMTAKNFQEIQSLVGNFLSTDKQYWTIVEKCEIAGPFEGWHESLSLVDLPGTNDTNAQRAKITSSLREKAQAVAICTSDSNLGIDIESWLRNSSVLAEFVEANESRRQRIFIIRTKLDSFQPDDYLPETEVDEDQEDLLFRQAIQDYKNNQTKAYHDMLREMISPLLPAYSKDPAIEQKRKSLLDGVEALPVFFVSAIAYEVFMNRSTCGRRQMNRLREHFGDEISATGIPRLLENINATAAEYLEINFYDDLASELEAEVGHLARYFQRNQQIVKAQLQGGGLAIDKFGKQVRNELMPWLGNAVTEKVEGVSARGEEITNALHNRMKQSEAVSDRRLKDKTDKWRHYAWNSLKAAARKDGSHKTARGEHIDIVNDVCSVLVDDLLLMWSSYRDELVSVHVDELTNELSQELGNRLRCFSESFEDPAAREAAQSVVDHLDSLTASKRGQFLRKVEDLLREVESIRKPVHDFIKDRYAPIFTDIQGEFGTGCQQRMRQHLTDGFDQNIQAIKSFTYSKIKECIDKIIRVSRTSVEGFGNETVLILDETVNEICDKRREDVRPALEVKHRVLTHAVQRLAG